MVKKTKVLFFARRFFPLIGGVEKHTLEVGKRLVKQGYEVVVITENYQSLPSSAKIEGIQIYRVKVGNENWIKKFIVWIKLFKYIGVIKSSDIVHCHDIFFWYLPFRFLFPFKKVFTTFHGYEGNSLPTKKSILM
ncbi:MAG TPA: glycosyltransferase, partial [Candidatus Sulfotelmatobacter sp.]|nr:glycosyltransferase [Candidatus Sulfotelmatobacter sp.]